MSVVFDPTVNYGEIIEGVSLFSAGVVAMATMQSNMKSHHERLGKLEGAVTKISDVLISVARQDERLNAIEHIIKKV